MTPPPEKPKPPTRLQMLRDLIPLSILIAHQKYKAQERDYWRNITERFNREICKGLRYDQMYGSSPRPIREIVNNLRRDAQSIYAPMEISQIRPRGDSINLAEEYEHIQERIRESLS